MSFKYREFKTQEEIDSFFRKISEHIKHVRNLDEYIIDWYKKDGIKIHGCLVILKTYYVIAKQ